MWEDGFLQNGGKEENIMVADAIINPLVILSAKTYDIMLRLRLKETRGLRPTDVV